MEQPVKGQVAIVTGAGQGIGRAIALRLAQDGYKLVVADLKAENVSRLAGEINQLGGQALAHQVDLVNQAERQRLIETTLATFDALDVLVNNAGIQLVSMPLDVTEEHWDKMMDVNAKSVYFTCVL